MESIYLSEEHEALRAQIRRFVDEEIRPYGDQWEKDGKVPRELLRTMGELGLFGIVTPSDQGGVEMGTMGLVVLADELGRSTYGGVTVTVMVHAAMASPHLLYAGNEEQLARYLPGILSGERISAITVSEPDAGSDVSALRTRAQRDGDEWVLNGAKTYISNGVYGNLYFVAAVTDPQAKPSRGMSMFIVEGGTPGLTVSRKLEKTGDLCSDTAELVFEDCRIPAANLLGPENQGFYALMHNFQRERICLGAVATAEATHALEITLQYLSEREVFGAPLLTRQAIRHRLAALQCKVEAGRQLVYHAAWLLDSGRDCVAEASMVKAYCCEVVNEVMYACQQFHGGMGYMRESAIERMVRDARLHAIGGGATEIMYEQIAKRWAP